jgi:DNA-binding CsgD family transcriptional regulator
MQKLEDKIKEIVELHQRDEQILQMRKAGKTYQEIADRVGITKQRVHAIYQRMCKEMAG